MNNLKTVLAQYSTMLDNFNTTNYWTDAELLSYLNMAYREFCTRTRILNRHTSLEVTDEGNSYIIPDDILEFISVRYKGKPLDRKDIKYIESRYLGTSHFEATGGEGRNYNGRDWRSIKGCPVHWFISDNYIHCFPRPCDSADYAPYGSLMEKYRKLFFVQTVAGASAINFPKKFPTISKTLVDIYINGVMCNPADYTLSNVSNGVDVVTKISFANAMDYEADVLAVVWNTPVMVFQNTVSLSSGNKSKSFTNSELTSDSVVRISVNGVAWRENDNYTISGSGTSRTVSFINYTAQSGDSMVATIYNVQPAMDDNTVPGISDGNMDIDYIAIPQELTMSDSPEIPSTFHDAIWQYAAYLALTREGQQTQDYQKAQVYREMFEQHVSRALRFVSAPVDVDFAVTQPFFV